MALEIPDLDDKRYAELVREAVATIPVRAPAWTDHNATDPGITLVELFAWLAEMQIYGLNCLTPDHYRTFLRLLGVAPAPAAAATVTLTLSSASGWEGVIPRGTGLVAEGDGASLPFETTEELALLDNRLAAVVSVRADGFRNCTEANGRDALFFYPFGENPQPGNTFYLAFARPLAPGMTIRLGIDLCEADLPPPATHRNESAPQAASVELVWEYATAAGYRPLPLSGDDTARLTRSGRVLFSVPADLAAVNSPYLPPATPPVRLPIIRCRLEAGAYEIPPRFDAVRLNTVTARQMLTLADELLVAKDGATAGNGMPGQRFLLAQRPVLEGTLTLRVLNGATEEVWQQRDHCAASGPTDRHFTLDPEQGELRFGDGLHGLALPVGATVRASYCAGGGAAGNIPALASWRFEPPLAGDISVRNEAAAIGGRDRETLDVAIARAPLEVEYLDRAVTVDDFAALALATPGLRVARATALPLWEPGTAEERTAPATVTVVVVPWSFVARPYPGPRFLRAVCDHLDRHRLVTTRVRVIPPSYARVSVVARLRAAVGVPPDDLRQRVTQRLLEFLHPLRGGEEGTGWPFGRGVYRSEVMAAVREVSGVDCVIELSLAGDAATRPDGLGNLLLDRETLVYSERHEVEVLGPLGQCTVIR